MHSALSEFPTEFTSNTPGCLPPLNCPSLVANVTDRLPDLQKEAEDTAAAISSLFASPPSTTPPLPPPSTPPSTPHSRCSLASSNSFEPLQESATSESTTSPRPASPDSGRPCPHEFPLWCHQNEYCRCYDPHAQLSKWTRPTDGSRPRKLSFGCLSSSGYPLGFKTLPNLTPCIESDYLPLYSTPPKGVPRPVCVSDKEAARLIRCQRDAASTSAPMPTSPPPASDSSPPPAPAAGLRRSSRSPHLSLPAPLSPHPASVPTPSLPLPRPRRSHRLAKRAAAVHAS